MKFATTVSYGGQRLSVGRLVIIKTETGYSAAMIESVDDNDKCWVVRLGDDESMRLGEFKTVANENDLGALPVGCWTWPPRV